MLEAALIVSLVLNAALVAGGLLLFVKTLHTFQERARDADRQNVKMFVETIDRIVANAAKERQALEDRLMAVCEPEQLSLFKAVEDPSENKATYMDEESEYATEEGEVVYVDPEASSNGSAGS